MRRAALAATCALAAALGGCGSGGAAAPLAWHGLPQAFRQHDLPNDRVVLASVQNRSRKPLRLEAARLVVRDRDGRVLQSSAQFIGSYAHGLYGAFQKPHPLPPQELSRLGLAISLAPHAVAPLTVAWRLAPGSREPATVDYGAGTLRLPASSGFAPR
ncbi:MAG: hypothetical protein NVSMB25_15070 [Thermoleophilaceae bacterium]